MAKIIETSCRPTELAKHFEKILPIGVAIKQSGGFFTINFGEKHGNTIYIEERKEKTILKIFSKTKKEIIPIINEIVGRPNDTSDKRQFMSWHQVSTQKIFEICMKFCQHAGLNAEPIYDSKVREYIEENSSNFDVFLDEDCPKNQILFGPPGTGKTHATIDEALKIINPSFFYKNLDDRKVIKDEFDRMLLEERIKFVTFHQSFSYEDFVEGIRAVPPEASKLGQTGIQYRVEDGVFLTLCDNARRNRSLDEQAQIRQDAVVWKMSIGEASGEADTRQYCFDHDEARIGWPNTGDLSAAGLNLADPIHNLGAKEQASLENFSRYMEPGDVVVCLATKRTISAVGVVTGAYEYTPTVPDKVRPDYVHRIPVRWLWQGIDFDIVNLNGGKQLTLQTVYELSRIRWPNLYDALNKAGLKPKVEMATATQEPLPYLLIIDEINRGNVSRIFGELITLIEDSKRDGQPEALSTTLPYSRRKFSVPDNVYLLGTMNTADRSLANMDVALRRRFSFKPMGPQPELLADVLVEGQIPVQNLLYKINLRIEALLGPDYLLGHAWFMPLKEDKSLARLSDIFRRQILPQLQEYFFDDWDRIRWVLNDHRKGRREEYCFIRSRGVDTNDLFGPNVQVSPRPLWEVNVEAFKHVGTYLATIDMNLLETDA